MRRSNPLFLVLALLIVFVPASAHAGLQIAGGKAKREKRETREKREKWETMPRRGIYVGTSIRPGAAGHANTFAPVLQNQWEVGGGITDHFTLGVALGGTAYLGMDEVSFDADVVAHRFIGKGFFLRGAAGVSSSAPALNRFSLAPAVGGSAGLGYEFRVLERIGVGLGVDYDLRMRTDGEMTQAWLLGLRFTAYFNKKKK